MRWMGLALLVAACGGAPEPIAVQPGVTDGREPVVRVELKSLGPWDERTVAGKGGLRVTAGDVDVAVQEPVKLTRYKGGKRVVVGVAGNPVRPHIVLRPLEGVFTIDGHTYAGSLIVDQGRLINRITMENYVLGVLRGELPLKRAPKAAAAAQAIAVRSYTMHYLAQARADIDLDDTTQYQRYVGMKYAPDDGNLRAGVLATMGLYLDSGGEPLKAYYHSTCGGHTTDVPTGLNRKADPAMPGVECDYCKASKYYRWQTDLTGEEIVRAARMSGKLGQFEVGRRGPGDRAREFLLGTQDGGPRFNIVHANELRLALGPSKLRSVRILGIEKTARGYRVKGGGWGHGVGLCQMGAIGMAEEGRAGKEIAAYYYPGATIRRAY